MEGRSPGSRKGPVPAHTGRWESSTTTPAISKPYWSAKRRPNAIALGLRDRSPPFNLWSRRWPNMIHSKLISRAAEIELAFEEVERIIGTSLPDSAARPQWWANETNPDSSHVQCRAWRTAGYDAFLLPGRR